MKIDIYISHIIGWCPIYEDYLLDTGYNDDFDHEWRLTTSKVK